MIKERTQLIIRLVSSHLLLVPVVIGTSVFVNNDSFLLLSISQSLTLILFLTGYWEFFGMRFRLIYSIVAEVLMVSVFTWKTSCISGSGNAYLITAIAVIQAYLLFELIKMFVVIFKHDKNEFDISFPFKKGKYLVTDGGNSRISRLMNYHYYSTVHRKNKTNNSMLYATDIVRIDNNDNRFLPLRNEDYPIFGEKVYSPLSGVVVKVENGINDNIPYTGGYPYNTGNTIVIRKDNLYMLLGHLKKGSIRVEVNQLVSENEYVADAGNSGYSERPHIHMQLIDSNTDNYWHGRGVSIRFGNKNLFKNRIVKIDQENETH
jgi:hypothetical protein